MKTVEVDMAAHLFTSAFGKDLVMPADGLDATRIDAHAYGVGKGIGARGVDTGNTLTPDANSSATSNAWGVNLSDSTGQRLQFSRVPKLQDFWRPARLRKRHKTHKNKLPRSAANAGRCPCVA